jgi:hypothetical protein
MPYELFAVIMAQNSETLVLKPFAMSWVLSTSFRVHIREGPIRRTREGGGSEWETIKILLEGDGGSNKMNMASNTRFRLNYPSWSRPHSH